MGQEALGLPLEGKVADSTVKTEYGAKRNSYSPSTLVFSTKFACLHRCLHPQHHGKQSASVARALSARLNDFSPRGSTRMIQ